jgi:KUP system potassium uptake protein
MSSKNKGHHHSAITAGGLLVTLGIIYGDIGTSPLYVLKAILEHKVVQQELILGALSCIFWTLTLQTTFKYVILTLQADNNGEGGIFSLYALIRRKVKWLTIPAIIGGSALLADGIITPPISVASAVEGLQILYPNLKTIPIVIGIITLLFMAQRFGTKAVGVAFGPIMFVWFSMLAVLGLNQLIASPGVFKALNPMYAYDLIVLYPGGFWLLGAVFLCTTGAEALYSDLGHCGKENIRLSWGFVKICLLLNYFGQGAWLLSRQDLLVTENPFFAIMPEWFLITGIVIATSAAIIASQALITGSFTLVSEAIRLNFWPKLRLVYPTDNKGQLYIPSINLLLWMGCIAVVLYFEESAKMEAAYGLSITITMLMTTLLLGNYLLLKKTNYWLVIIFNIVYISLELSFLAANLTKFKHGGFVTLIIGSAIILVMYIWLKASKIKNRLTEFVSLNDYIAPMKELSVDESIPKYATNLVFMTGSDRKNLVESKIIYSLFYKKPKRADIYWFIHVDITDEPYTKEYRVDFLEQNDIIKVTLRLGFRVEQRINLYFRNIVEDLVKNGEVDITSRYASLHKQKINGDFKFIVLEKFLSYENDLPIHDQLVMDGYFFLKHFTTHEIKWFGLDTSLVTVEKVPLLIRPIGEMHLDRIN